MPRVCARAALEQWEGRAESASLAEKGGGYWAWLCGNEEVSCLSVRAFPCLWRRAWNRNRLTQWPAAPLRQVLDHFFSGVCELDLVFGFNKVYMIIDEFFMAGEVQETSKRVILERLEELMRQE